MADSLAARVETGAPALGLPHARSARARVLAERGQADEACAHADWLVATVRAGWRGGRDCPRRRGARRCGAGDLKQAAAIIAQLERAPRIRDNFKYPSLLPELVRTALACSEPVVAERLTEG